MSPEKNAQTASVPLGDWHGRPVVELTIAGEGPFRFILDSGAGVTVIDHALAGRFELKELGKTEIGSPLGGTVPATRLQLQDLRLGSNEFGPVEALDMDLAAVIGAGDSPVGVLATSDGLTVPLPHVFHPGPVGNDAPTPSRRDPPKGGRSAGAASRRLWIREQ